MIKGVIAGNFDVLHPGYVKMFKEMRQHCDTLVVFLHEDPSLERPLKMKPVLSVEDRKFMLSNLGLADDIISYNYEAVLYDLLSVGEFDIRFLGDDYKNKPFTGDDLKIPIHYLNRAHGWSTTKFKTLVANSLKEIDERPWGKYEVLLDAENVKVKRITVNPGQKLSYQYHEKRREVWTVVEGMLTIVLEDEKLFRGKGQSVRIPLGAKHRAWNETDEEVIFIEVQTGTYFGEDDIVRLKDDYNRTD